MNQKILSALGHLSNHELITQLTRLAEREREATVSLVAHLAELDKRRLYLAEGYSSLFAYCTQVLHLSEHAAYGRIEAARLARRFPVILGMFQDGRVNLTTVRLLAAHLTDENHLEVLDMARNKSKRQVEELLARLHPQPAAPSTIRKLPTTNPLPVSSATQHDSSANTHRADDGQEGPARDLPSLTFTSSPGRSATIAPLAPERYKVQFTASAETYRKLRLAQNLLRHQIPDGDPAEIFDRALTVLLEDLAKKKLAATDRPRETGERIPGSRHIPADVKRAVWLRDGGCCTS